MAQSKPIAQGIDITERKPAEKTLSREKNFSDAVMNSSPGLLFVFDDKGNIIQWNRNAERVTGYSAKEISKMNVLDFVAKEDQKTAAEAMQEVFTKGQASLEMKILSKPGKETPFYITGLRTKFENTTCVVCTGIDITERKQVEESLHQSEERFRVLFEQAADCILLLEITPEGIPVIRDANNATFRLLGYERDEVIGQSVSFMEAAPDASKVVDERRENVLSASGTTTFEARHRCKDGTIRDFECSVTEMQIGSKTLAVSVERDITERKRTEEALRESETRYRTLFQATSDSILIADLETKIFRYANPAACRLLGYSETELTTIGVAAIHPKADLPRVMAEFEAQVRGDKTLAVDLPCLRKDGTIVYVDVTASAMTIDGRACLVGFFRDITERKLADEKLLQSEKRYRTIIENIEDGYFEVDLTGTFTFVNDAQCRNAGTPREQLLGKNNRAYTTEEEAKKLYELFSGVYKTGEPVTGFDLEYRKRNGTMAFNEMSVSLIRDSEGKPIGFRGITRDVTERRQMEEALRETTSYLDSLISYANTPIIVWNPEFKITRFNHAFERLSGYTADEVIGHQLHMLFPEASRDESLSKIARTASGEYWESVEITILRKDGDIRVALWNSANIYKKEGGTILLATIAQGTDITERKRVAEQLQRYAAELERSNEEVKNFAYIVSHDLRVPLVNLKGYTSELRSALEVIGSNFDAALPHLIDEKRSAVATALHEDVPEALEFITNSVTRMDSFINAVLILARLGRQDLKPEPIDMNALVQISVETMSHQLQERGIEVIVASLPHVVADRTSMEQIIGNILSNAVKYLDSSRPGRIEVTAQDNGAETTFRIRDNGRGIAAEDMAKVFAPFRRAGKQDTPGEGMGLAYVQTLLRRHGGLISCESELGKGTTFTFTISTRSEKGARDA
jgi:PAS domain S-box-containing protein